MIEFLNEYWYLIGAISAFAFTMTICICFDDKGMVEDPLLSALIMGVAWIVLVPTVLLVVIVGTLKDLLNK